MPDPPPVAHAFLSFFDGPSPFEPVHLPFWFFAVALIFAFLFWGYFSRLEWLQRQKEIRDRQVRIGHLEQKAEQEPEKVRYAWDLARAKLETYFDRNLNQVRLIFYIAVGVMVAGFGFILWGLRVAIANPDRFKVTLIASAAGVVTQFIGLTFMAIYRSTMLQAAQFMSVLERINTVGMAVQILDAMKDDLGDLKDATRVDIIRLLLAPPSAEMKFTPRTRNLKSKDM